MADELPEKEAHLFCVRFFPVYEKIPIDKYCRRVYNTFITLSRAAEVTGPVKPQQPDL